MKRALALFFLDNNPASDYSGNPLGICHCDNCKRLFRARFGRELPLKADSDYQAFLRESACALPSLKSTDVAVCGRRLSSVRRQIARHAHSALDVRAGGVGAGGLRDYGMGNIAWLPWHAVGAGKDLAISNAGGYTQFTLPELVQYELVDLHGENNR